MSDQVARGVPLATEIRKPDLVATAAEEFHYACGQDFNETLTKYRDALVTPIVPSGLGSGGQLDMTVVLDEPALQPPVDLNGDGDFDDTGLDPADVNLAVLQLVIRWTGVTGERRAAFTTMLARGEAR